MLIFFVKRKNEFKNFSEYNLIDILDQSLVLRNKFSFRFFFCGEEMEDDWSLVTLQCYMGSDKSNYTVPRTFWIVLLYCDLMLLKE